MAVAHSVSAQVISPLSLLKRWVVDYFNRHDDGAAREFITPDYSLRIGDVVFAGRDTQWLPAVAQQMALFPNLAMTVHQTLAGPDWAAAWFSEHGASRGRAACWSGVAIYHCDGQRLINCVAQEDYLTRHRQMKSGVADLVEPPAVAPWDSAPQPADEEAMAVVRRWLSESWPPREASVRCDDEHITGVPLVFDVTHSEIDVLCASGPDVVFHARQEGVYRAGLAGVAPNQPRAVLHCNGMVRVSQGQVRHGRVIRDRVGLRARLNKEGALA
jgi:hypothetical protein